MVWLLQQQYSTVTNPVTAAIMGLNPSQDKIRYTCSSSDILGILSVSANLAFNSFMCTAPKIVMHISHHICN